MKLYRLIIAIIVFSVIWITGCSNNIGNELEDEENEFPPTMTGLIGINETEYEIASGGYRWERKLGLETQVVQTDHAGPYQMAGNIKAFTVNPDQKVTIKIEENPQLTVYLWNENGREKQITLKENQLTAPSSKGKYIYEVFAKWSNGEVSFTFVLEVQ